jgi:hypothetical protein
MPAAKQVVYVDVDDEITTIIEKMKGAEARVVALVLPKRAGVFQSVVNMKLLKRTAEQMDKHLVLITSEAALMPLAGLAGVYVARTLQSKPEIPAGPDDDLPDDIADETVSLDSAGDEFNPSKNAATPVGALASRQPGSVAGLPDDVQELDKAAPAGKRDGRMSSEMAAMAAGGAAAGKAGKDGSKPKDKNLSVPNFFKFRKGLVFAGLGLLLLIGVWYWAYWIAPTATINVRTKTTDIDADMNITLDTAAKEVDTKTTVVPAKLQQQKKDNTQQAPATGQENRGEKASGEVVLSLTGCSDDSVSIPAGTGLSSGGKTFITQSGATLNSVKIGGSCKNSDFPNISSATVPVVALKGGADHNLAASSFTGAPSGVKAASDKAMAGGTDNIIKLVQQSDIDAAKAKIAGAADKETIKKELVKQLESGGMLAIDETFNVAAGELTTSVKVGEQAEAVTVSETTSYTMYGVRKADLRKLIESHAEGKIDRSKQSIVDDGIDDAKFVIPAPGATPQLKVDMVATAVAGPQLDVEKIKTGSVGKKSGVVKEEIKSNPGVEDVSVKYSPFWVTKAPKPERTTVVFEKSSQAQTDDGDSASDE